MLHSQQRSPIIGALNARPLGLKMLDPVALPRAGA